MNKPAFNDFLDLGPQHSDGLKESILNSYKNVSDLSLVFRDDKKIYCKFPFFGVKSKLFGNRIISVPFVDVGGLCGELKFKDIKSLNFKKSFRADSVHVKLDESLKNFIRLKSILLSQNFLEVDNNHQFILELKPKEELWKKFHKHTRNDIRKASKSGLKLEKMDSLIQLKRFYNLYLREMHRFGTPQHSYLFFKELYQNNKVGFFGYNCYSNAKLIGSIIVLHSGKRGLVFVNVSNPSFRGVRPNDILYWEILQDSIKKRLDFLDLGQVNIGSEKGGREWSLYKFKKKWLAKPYKCSIFVKNLSGLPSNPKSSKMKFLRRVWSKLPLTIVRLIGPKIRSRLAI